MSNTDYESYTGTGTTFEGNPFEDFRIMWYYEQSPIQICVAAYAGVDSIYDLEGKSFNPGGTGTVASLVIHQAFDLLASIPITSKPVRPTPPMLTPIARSSAR